MVPNDGWRVYFLGKREEPPAGPTIFIGKKLFFIDIIYDILIYLDPPSQLNSGLKSDPESDSESAVKSNSESDSKSNLKEHVPPSLNRIHP
jgi:hypothetical protein